MSEIKEMKYEAKRIREVLASGRIFGLQYYILNLGYCPAAYIKLPDNVKINDEDIDVHGGITYIADHLYIAFNTMIQGNFIGWDYAHCDDYLGFYEDMNIYNGLLNIEMKGKKWATEEILMEVQKACHQIQSKILKGDCNNEQGDKNKNK